MMALRNALSPTKGRSSSKTMFGKRPGSGKLDEDGTRSEASTAGCESASVHEFDRVSNSSTTRSINSPHNKAPSFCGSPKNSTMSDRSPLPPVAGFGSPKNQDRLSGNFGSVPAQDSLFVQKKSWAVSDFKVVKTVGTGFMGSVRVVKMANGPDRSPYALKIMKKAEVIKRKQVAHVMAERQLLGQVNHPFIVKLLTTFQDDARLFMLMEFVNGGELFSAIRRAKRLPNDSAKFYGAEVILALGHLHSMDICYRDLKPENILLDAKGHAKVTDFGFAKVVETRTWTLCGTPEYLAPEIITTQGHGKPVDWWAVGVLIFEMLAGQAPFRGPSARDIYQKVLHEDPVFPTYFSNDVQSLIKKLLNKDKSRRLGSGVNGVQDIQAHRWFAGIDMDLLLRRKYPPPYVPQVQDESDTKMFDSYPEEAVSAIVSSNLTAKEQQQFQDF